VTPIFPYTRRSVVAGLAVAGWAGRASGRSVPSAGPLAESSRVELSGRVATYLALVATGDPRRFAYRTGRTVLDALDAALHGRSATVRALALDEAAGLLAVEFLLEPAGGQQEEARIVFFELDGGYITGTILVESGAQFIPGDGNPLPRPRRAEDEPLPESVRLRSMTPRKFRDYLDLFGRFDERFVEYYTPHVVFAAAPAPAPLHGREAVLDLYRPLRAELGENVTVHHLAIDNEAGIMVAALSNRLSAFGNVKLPSRQLRPGDQLALSGAIIYELRGGRISRIRDVGG
jgi:hypothetical protein